IVQFAIIANDNNSLSNQSLSAIARVFPDAMSLSDGDINLFHSNSRNIAITSLLYKQGFYLAVEETYKKAEKEPRHPFFVLNYARSLVKMGEMDKATEVYEKLSERHPTLTSPKIELAELL